MMPSLRNRHDYKFLKYIPLDADQTTLQSFYLVVVVSSTIQIVMKMVLWFMK